MTQLALAVDADDELWTLDSIPATRYVQVDDETVEVRSPFPSQTYTLTGQEQPPRIRVRRGVGGTTAASHNNATTLTPVYVPSAGGGGGAIAVDNTVDPPAEVTTLIAPGADLSTPGEADLSSILGEQTIRLIEKHIAFDDADLTIEGTDPDVGTFPGVLWTTLAAETLILGVFAKAITDSGDSHSWTNEGFGDVSLFVGGSTDPLQSQTLTAVQIGGGVGSPHGGPPYEFMYRKWPGDDSAANPYALWDGGPVHVAVQYDVGPLTSGTLDIYLLIAEPAA